MGLNMKNPITERLIKELASLTGESQTEAVTRAVEERLKKLRRKEALQTRIWEIIEDAAPRFKEPWKSIDHGELLYDEKGLPK